MLCRYLVYIHMRSASPNSRLPLCCSSAISSVSTFSRCHSEDFETYQREYRQDYASSDRPLASRELPWIHKQGIDRYHAPSKPTYCNRHMILAIPGTRSPVTTSSLRSIHGFDTGCRCLDVENNPCKISPLVRGTMISSGKPFTPSPKETTPDNHYSSLFCCFRLGSCWTSRSTRTHLPSSCGTSLY